MQSQRRCCAYRRAVTSKGQMGRVDQAFADGLIQELLPVEPEDEGEGILRLQVPALQQRKEPGSHAGRVTGSLFAFLLPLWRLHFREPVLWGEVVLAAFPDAGEEVIKSADTRGIISREAAEDGIQRGSLSMRHQTVMEVTFSFRASR